MRNENLEYSGASRGADTWIYTLTGNLYGSSAGYEFQETVRTKIASGVKRVVIDLEQVGRIDSSGVGILVATMWSASQAGAGLVMASLSPSVERVLSIAMLLDRIDHADSVENALARLDAMQDGASE